MPKNNKHLHIYKRIKERPDYYQCIHPDCTHYIHRMFLRNKRATCYVCHEPFVIASKTLCYAKLRCEDCRAGKPKILSKTAELEQIIQSLED